MENRITFAVVGCGRIGVRHIETIVNHNQAHLVATVDPKGAPNASEEHPETVPHFDSLEAFLAAGIQADVVNIATPNGCHAAQAISLLEAGYHVLIEKPLALTKSDAEKVLHTALTKGKRVFAVMQNRYSPPSEWLKSLVQSGALGNIYQVHLNCFWNRDER